VRETRLKPVNPRIDRARQELRLQLAPPVKGDCCMRMHARTGLDDGEHSASDMDDFSREPFREPHSKH
jgi:hypothetical protein